MSGISVKIGGKPVLATSGVAWELTQGVAPHIGRFEMPTSVVDELKERAGSVTLEISDGTHTVEIKKLYIIGDAPGPNPEIETIIVADRRYWWPYAHVLRRYNMRRHIGHRRLTDEKVLELQPVDPDVWYAPYSLPGGNKDAAPWTARQAFTNVLFEVIDHGPDVGDAGDVDFQSLPELDSLPFENVEVDDNGKDALRRLLDYIPGLGITLKADGTVVAYSRVDGKENKPLAEEWEEYKNFGHLKAVSKALIRPEAIEVLFSREFEIRVDFEDLGVTSSTTTARDDDEIFAQNVLPNPDFQLPGTDIPRGAWITLQRAYAAWNGAGGGMPPSGTQITSKMIRQAMVPYNGFWAYYNQQGLKDPDNDWGARFAALQTHWRTTYRINRRFIDRTFGIYGYRLATINPESGTRAPAICYSDYCVIPGPRMNMQAKNLDEFSYAMNFRGYPSGGAANNGLVAVGDNTKPAPAVVQVIDKDQGIIHVDWKIDPLRTYEQIMPGFIQDPRDGAALAGNKPANPGPMADLSDRNSNISFNSVFKGGLASITEMSSGYKCILMLTAVPASPNNDSQLQRVKVVPGDVKDLLPGALEGGLNDARGPVMEIRIGAGIETARVRWIDSRRDDIYQALGIGNDDAEPSEANIDDLVINLDQGGGTADNAASLTAIARAAAASVYATFADRTEGSAAYRLRPELHPEGRTGSVSFGVTAQGLPHTLITIPEDFPPINFRSLLPASDRSIIDRLAVRDT